MTTFPAEHFLFGLRLRRLREGCGLTQEELAALLTPSVFDESISEWESAHHHPRPQSLERLAQALDVEVTELRV